MTKLLVTSSDRLDMLLAAATSVGLEILILDSKKRRVSNEIANVIYHRTIENTEKYKSELAEILNSGSVDYAMTTSGYDDTLFYESSVAYASSFPIKNQIFHQPSVLHICNNKSYTKEFANLLGLNTANIYKANEIDNNFDKFPIVFKKNCLWSGIGIEIVEGRVDFHDGRFNDGYFEEFIDAMEVSVNVFSRNGRHTFFPPVYKGKTSLDLTHPLEKVRVVTSWDVERNKTIKPIVETIAKNLQGNGWFDIELLVAKDKIYLMEINARYSGITKLNYISTGVNPYQVALDSLVSEFSENNLYFSYVNTCNFSIETPITSKIDTSADNIEGLLVHISTTMKNTIGRVTYSADSTELLFDSLNKILSRKDFDFFKNGLEFYKNAEIV